MNNIILKGIIRNIRYSHTLNDIEYDQADVIVTRVDGKQDIVPIKFKKFINKYSEGDSINIIGNVRSRSSQETKDKNRVNIYVLTYQDFPDVNEEHYEDSNYFEITGRVCKTDKLRITESGKHHLHFILANNIKPNNKIKINNYLPCVCWGNVAREYKEIKVNDTIKICGEFHSRTYKKYINEDEIEIKVANELFVKDITIISEGEL